MKHFLFLVLLVTLFSGCDLFTKAAVPTPTPALPEIMKESNVLENTKASETSFQLYRLLASDPQNVNFSPLSLKIAFSLLYPGTNGSTQKLFEQIFGFSEEVPNPMQPEYQLAEKMDQQKVEGNTLEIHNSVWSKRVSEVKPAFVETLKLQDASIAKINLDAINAWVAKSTQNKIQKFLPSLPDKTSMILINTIFFKQKWASPFDINKTSVASFQASPNLSQNVMTLHDRKDVLYFEDTSSKWIALPYANSPFVMYFSIPKKRFDLRSVEEKISSSSLNTVISKMKKEPVEIALPRFKLNQKTSLRSLLTSAGYADLFTKGDYSGVTSEHKLVLSDVLQAAAIEVNETGTEASAATGITLMEKGVATDPILAKSFVADQPFLFILRNEETKNLYWLGRVYAPLGTAP